jgi:CheY-like chemotaxis protein
MADAVRAVMPLNRNPDLLLAFDWEGDPCWVHGDDSCLRQIVTNLLGNAIKFTPCGLVSLRGHCRRVGPDQVSLVLEVSDTGPGISAALRAEVFEPFVQADNSLARVHGGAGLGLAIASRLAEAMHAPLQLRCPDGGGSVFNLTLNLPWAPTPPDVSLARPSMPGTAWLVYHRAEAAKWVGRRLARLGWQIRIVEGLPAALALVQDPDTLRPSVVILAERAFVETDDLTSLRHALPETALRLLVRPHWHHPRLETQANTLQIPILVAPLTPDQLVYIAADQAIEARVAADRRASAPALLPQAEVLLVEDNPVNQLVGQGFLQALGLAVRLADDGEAALAACLAQAPDLVLMDLEMPGMDGLQATRRLRALQREGLWPGAPIVALTAHAGAADRAACRAAGMDGVLTKPLSLDTLRKQLGRWLAL